MTFPSFSKQVNWWQHYSAEAAARSLGAAWQTCKAARAEHPLPGETGGCAGQLQPGETGIHGKVCWDLSKEMRPRADFFFFNENRVIDYKKRWYFCVLRTLRFPQIWSFKMFISLLSMKTAHRTAVCVYISVTLFFCSWDKKWFIRKKQPEFKVVFQTMECTWHSSTAPVCWHAGVGTNLPQTSLWRSATGCTAKLKTNSAAVSREGTKEAEIAVSPGCLVKE